MSDDQDRARLVMVDPATLVVGTNVRAEARVTPQFVASVRQHGVLTPVLVQDTGGQMVVRAGQRRTLAAVEAGLRQMPALVVVGDDDAPERIVQQIVENDQRVGLTTGERATGFEQLALLGVSAAQIARRTGAGRAEVDAGLAVARSQVATDAASDYGLDLTQAATVAEFEGDTEAVEHLLAVAEDDPAMLDHAAQRLRDERRHRAERTEREAVLAADGLTVVPAPAWDDPVPVQLRDLVSSSDTGRPMGEDEHAGCPGRVVWLATTWGDDSWRTVHGCADPQAHGHTVRPGRPVARSGGKMTEEQKAERRTLVANNKAWDSATTVRREWLRTFAARKTSPKDGPKVLASCLAGRWAPGQDDALARDLLGLGAVPGWGQDDPLAETVAAAPPARAAHLALVLVLAAVEARTSRNTWRVPDAESRAHLTALAAWGYQLSDVENLVLDG